METYHLAWLSVHPERTAEWLRAQLADGFHVHHIDGDHQNDDPGNLVLIDGTDHLRLHGMKLSDGIQKWRARNASRSTPPNPADAELYRMRIGFDGTWADLAKTYHEGVKPSDASWHDLGAYLMKMARRHSVKADLPWPPVETRRFQPMDASAVAAMLSRQ